MSKTSSIKVQLFSNTPITYFLKYFPGKILWNTYEWFSRDLRIFEKAVLHSIRIFLLTMHVLSSRYKEKSENCWVLYIGTLFNISF